MSKKAVHWKGKEIPVTISAIRGKRIGPLMEKPKSYIYVGLLTHNFGNLYNSHFMYIFRVKGKEELRCAMFRDGCFDPFYAKLRVHDLELKNEILFKWEEKPWRVDD